MKIKDPIFEDFLECFPSIELPITITQESRFEFAKVNKPFPQSIIEKYVVPLEQEEIDEFTEFEPCLRFGDGQEFTGIIYWRGKMYAYDYILVTYDSKSNVVARKIIAGTRFDKEHVRESVANITEDYIISIVVGQKDQSDQEYNPDMSQSMTMEILSTGDIIFTLQE